MFILNTISCCETEKFKAKNYQTTINTKTSLYLKRQLPISKPP